MLFSKQEFLRWCSEVGYKQAKKTALKYGTPQKDIDNWTAPILNRETKDLGDTRGKHLAYKLERKE